MMRFHDIAAYRQVLQLIFYFLSCTYSAISPHALTAVTCLWLSPAIYICRDYEPLLCHFYAVVSRTFCYSCLSGV